MTILIYWWFPLFLVLPLRDLSPEERVVALRHSLTSDVVEARRD